MKKFLVLIFCFPIVCINAQERLLIKKDTVDLIEVLVGIYHGDSKFKAKPPYDSQYDYHFKNVVFKAEANFPNQSLNSIISSRSYGIGSLLRARLNSKDSIVELKYAIGFTNCNFLGTQIKAANGNRIFKTTLFDKISFAGLRLENCEGGRIGFVECKFDNRTIQGSSFYYYENDIGFINCSIKSELFFVTNHNLRIKGSHLYQGAYIRNYSGDFELINSTVQNKLADTVRLDSKNIDYHKLYFESYSNRTVETLKLSPNVSSTLLSLSHEHKNEELATVDRSPSITIRKSEFISQIENSWILIDGQYKRIEISENALSPNLSFVKSKIEDKFSCRSNTGMNSIFLDRVLFSELQNDIEWETIDNYSLRVKEIEDNRGTDILATSYSGKEAKLFLEKTNYFRLIELYKFLFENYKTKGNVEYSNACYAEMKQIETRRWKYLFEQNKTFESFFRWQLNVFLSYFTDYGTNPAKAVIKSAWVILLFAIFYLFFPSDWDVSNRSQLLAKLKDLSSKNREKSFMATLAFVAYSGFIHILNALTLSLNAFTTLGFGDIPTHGAARYVTIVQGFIGWFLLTIFSVSLINQVLG